MSSSPIESSDRYLLSINDIQERFIPLSKKRIRKFLLDNFDVIRVGGRILIRKDDLVNYLSSHDLEKL